MLKIKRGSLVCMGRRSIKGQGLVLDRIQDINEYAEGAIIVKKVMKIDIFSH